MFIYSKWKQSIYGINPMLTHLLIWLNPKCKHYYLKKLSYIFRSNEKLILNFYIQLQIAIRKTVRRVRNFISRWLINEFFAVNSRSIRPNGVCLSVHPSVQAKKNMFFKGWWKVFVQYSWSLQSNAVWMKPEALKTQTQKARLR